MIVMDFLNEHIMIHPRNFLLFGLIISLTTACASLPTPEPAPVSQVESPPAPPRPSPTPAPLGTNENPLVLALPPAQTTSNARIQAANSLSAELSALTGYTLVVVQPATEGNLVRAIEAGNVHIAMLSPYAYVLAYQKGLVHASFARTKAGEKTYGAQYIARAEAGFKSYFDARNEENTAEAAEALSQFKDKKPCWTDPSSLSGFIVPAGILAQNGIPTRSPAVLGGHPPVVQAVYSGGICDFGATYIDARAFPVIKDKNPDIMERVQVIWRVPPVIPHEVFVLTRRMPPEMLNALEDAIFRIAGMESGKLLLHDSFGAAEWERISDTFYAQFRTFVIASGADLDEIIE
ncbi:MAG: hypothetical protein Kow002_15080 [Anaerolineales bacterium]